MKMIEIGAQEGGPATPSAPRALWLHGNDLCAEFYAPLAHALAGHGVASTLLTLPGFAGEPPLAAPSWSALADAIVTDGARAVGSQSRWALVGHSMGGLLALLVAARTPAWLDRLVLLEPAVFPWRTAARVAGWRYLRRVVDAPGHAFDNYNGGMTRIADPARFPASAMAHHRAARAARDDHTVRTLFSSLSALYPLPYAAVRVPALVVRGARTGAVGRWMANDVARQLGALPPLVIPGAAHWLANEQDARVADAIAPFLVGGSRGTAPA